jgi:hypothetical protein
MTSFVDSDPVPAIGGLAATDETAEISADIRSTLDVEVVNLISRRPPKGPRPQQWDQQVRSVQRPANNSMLAALASSPHPDRYDRASPAAAPGRVQEGKEKSLDNNLQLKSPSTDGGFKPGQGRVSHSVAASPVALVNLAFAWVEPLCDLT